MIATNDKMPDAKYLDLISFTQSLVLLSSNEATHTEFKTSADELALNVDTFTSFSHRTSIKA